MWKILRNRRGSTMLEVLATIIISTIIVGVCFSIMMLVIKTRDTVLPAQSVRYDVDYAYQKLSTLLANANNVVLSNPDTTKKDANGNYYLYMTMTITPRVDENGTPATQKIVISVPSATNNRSSNAPLSMSYVDSNGQPISTSKPSTFQTFSSNFSDTRFELLSSDSTGGSVILQLNANSIYNTIISLSQTTRIDYISNQ